MKLKLKTFIKFLFYILWGYLVRRIAKKYELDKIRK